VRVGKVPYFGYFGHRSHGKPNRQQQPHRKTIRHSAIPIQPQENPARSLSETSSQSGNKTTFTIEAAKQDS